MVRSDGPRQIANINVGLQLNFIEYYNKVLKYLTALVLTRKSFTILTFLQCLAAPNAHDNSQKVHFVGNFQTKNNELCSEMEVKEL